jgi:hypothetical protein
MRISRALMLLLAVSVVPVVAACSQGSVTTSAPRPARAAALFVAPFNGLTSTSSLESARLQRAEDLLLARCMRRRSFSYLVADAPWPADGSMPQSPYGLLSVATAESRGYGIADNVRINARDAQIAVGVQPQSGRRGFLKALAGTAAFARTIAMPGGGNISFDANGCVSIAIGELYGPSWNRTYYTIDPLAIIVADKVEASASWKKVVGDWSSCLRRKYGSNFASPAAVRAAVSNNVDTHVKRLSGAKLDAYLRNLRVAEVRVATIDATCQSDVRLAAVAQRVQQTVQRGYETRYAPELAEYSSDLRAAMRTATALLK